MERHRPLVPGKITRRTVLSAALIGLTAKAERTIGGSFVNDAFPLGHRIRDHKTFPIPNHQVKLPVVIVGGGMAGLCAAWHLDKRGFRDFVILEMEPNPGGNSRWGENEISRYPWAAHYVPVPNKDAALSRELFEEFGVLKDGKWDERMLCFAPQERLFLHGRWQDGIEPELAATRRDHDQFKRFQTLILEARATGQFTIPMEKGAKVSPLDRLSATQWMDQNKFDSPYLRWYVDYSCRDDYGARAHETSAWAGIHYFASREPEDKGPLTWPEGNGWIVNRLAQKLGKYLRTDSPVFHIARDGGKLRVLTAKTEYVADTVIFAAPTFLAHYIIDGMPPADFVYSPWLTANLTLDRLPVEPGIEAAWDNVIFESPALGYVNAKHMGVQSVVDRTVWTYYWSLDNRQILLEKDWGYWKDAILNDLSRAHTDIRNCVSRIDMMRFGHAMARPVPGFLGSAGRQQWAAASGNVLFANSDLSGFSIFEEAQYRGVVAADRALKKMGKAGHGP